MKERLIRGLAYGIAGWTAEVAFTGVKQGLRGERRLEGHTYLWMLPIYGLAAPLFEPLHDRIRDWPTGLRAATYAAGIMSVEYASGWALERAIGVCPWDYSERARLHLHGYVRLDYAPLWATAGLALERMHDALNVALPPAVESLRSRPAPVESGREET